MRNFGSSLGLAVLGSILILENQSNLESPRPPRACRRRSADEVADAISQGASGRKTSPQRSAPRRKVVDAIPHDFALATRTVFYGMAGVMAVAFVVALVAMPAGKVEEQVAKTTCRHRAGPRRSRLTLVRSAA